MSEKKCECAVCKCGGNNRLFEWIGNNTQRTGRAIKLAVKDYIDNRTGKKDKADIFFDKYCVGRFKLNDKSTYTLKWKDNDLIPVKIKEKKNESPKKSVVSHISEEELEDARYIIPKEAMKAFDEFAEKINNIS